MDIPTPVAFGQPPPSWLIPCLQLLAGTSLVYRYKPLCYLSVILSLYFVVHFYHHPPRAPFMVCFNFGSQLFGITVRILNGVFLQKGEDFTRLEKQSNTPSTAERKKQREQTKPATRVVPDSSKERLQRFYDALEVGFAANRGVGWKFQARNIPPGKPSDYPRWTFVTENLLAAAWRIVAADAINVYHRRTPLGDLTLEWDVLTTPLPIRLFRGLLGIFAGRFAIDAAYRIPAAVSVAVGMYDPSDWPPLMGRLGEAYTVRRAWSITWHQLMRCVASPPVTHLTKNILHFQRGSWLSDFFQVMSAFLVASVMHGYSTRLAGGNPVVDFQFFMLHAAVICVEDVVVSSARRLGIRDSQWTRLLGYLWTGAFATYTATFWLERYARSGAYAEPPFGFSIVDLVLERCGLA